MGVKFPGLCAVLTVAASIAMSAGGAIAQTVNPRTVEIETINEAFLDAFYNRSGTFFENRVPHRSFTWFLGPFPENDIAADAASVHRLYERVLTQQNQSDPYLRTPDVDNPFSSSLLLTPPYDNPPILEAGPSFYVPPVENVRRAPQPSVGPVPGLY